MEPDRNFRPRALSEVAIRCADMPAMVQFYGHVIGLERMSGGPDSAITFFRIAEGFGGHTAVLALFDTRTGSRPGLTHPTTAGASSLHHIALSLPFDEQDAVMRWYEHLGQPYRVEHFGWVGWRGVFTQDPEGNTELVAYDAGLLDGAS
jgi:catechol 2,3-dioxygenase-like lactoylglutathione lyase family enzyme